MNSGHHQNRHYFIYLLLVVLLLTIINSFGYSEDELITSDEFDGSIDNGTIVDNGTHINGTKITNITKGNTTSPTNSNEVQFDYPIIGIANNPNTSRPLLISKYQSPPRIIENNTKDGYNVLGGEFGDKNTIEITHTANYNGCVAMLGKVDDGCFVMTFNMNGSSSSSEAITGDNSIKNSRKIPGINCTNIAIDDTYIWLPTTQNRIEVLIHRDCKTIEATNISKALGKYLDFNGTDTSIIYADPRTKPYRSLYIYQQKTSVLTQYTYENSFVSLNVTSTTNIGDACYVNSIKNGQIMVSYHDGFRVFNISNDQSIPYDSPNIDKVDLCGPFLYDGTIYSITNNTSIIQIMPGVSSRVSYPCHGSSNGIIELKGALDQYTIRWLDNNSTRPRREGLNATTYRVTVTSKLLNKSRTLTFNLLPQRDLSKPLVRGVCQTDSNGTIDFGNVMTRDLNYSFTLYDQHKNITSKDGVFNHLRSKSYMIDITSVDEFKFKCSYRVEIPIKQGEIFLPEIKVTNPSCFNTSDAMVEIIDYYPDLYSYDMVPSQSVRQNNKFSNISYDSLYEYKLIVHEKNSTCVVPVKIEINSPPKPTLPKTEIIRAKQCYGELATVKVQYIKGMNYTLKKRDGGQVFESTRTELGFSYYTNIPVGSYDLLCKIPKSNGQGYCNSISDFSRIPINVTQIPKIQLEKTRITTQCDPDGKENLLVRASGGFPERNGDYYFIGKYANAKGAYLNVSYWVDGVYTITVADSKGCAVTYDNFTISRPAQCSIFYDHNGNVVHKAGAITPVINQHLALALGVGLGVGIPVLVAVIVGSVILYRHINKSRARPAPPPNSIPIYMGGKIQNIDNF